MPPRRAMPLLSALTVRNYRALRELNLTGLTPMSVFLGPNGSGKSTLFDVFAFLSECFTEGLRRAWDRRGRFRELRTRGQDGPIEIELQYRERSGVPLITYHLSIQEEAQRPYVAEEWLRWTRAPGAGRPFRFLDFANGSGIAIPGEHPLDTSERVHETLDSRDLLAVNTLGQFRSHPRVSALRRFITSWYLSYLSADSTRGQPEAGPQERLSSTGDNLPNVIQYLKEQHPQRLTGILATLARRVPRLESVEAEVMRDGRLLLQIKDAPFADPILARFASDGTLRMLAYLTLLNDPEPPQLIGIEEPENQLHPRLLPELAEECRSASGQSQLMITTHSPHFVNALRPEELWVLHRGPDGFTRATHVSKLKSIEPLVANGGLLGDLWMEGYLGVGDPFGTS